MDFNKTYRYGTIFAKCCANCKNKHRDSAFPSRLYCRVRAKCTKKRIGFRCNRTAPDGICMAHEYDAPMFLAIENVGFGKKKRQPEERLTSRSTCKKDK